MKNVLTILCLLWATSVLAQPFLMPPPGGITVTAPYGKGNTANSGKVTIASTNTYQQALPANTLRLGCTIQYVGSSTGYVFFGATPADTTTSIQLSPGQPVYCSTFTGGVLNTAVQVTGTSGDIFVVNEQ